jgi:hypothetical protein
MGASRQLWGLLQIIIWSVACAAPAISHDAAPTRAVGAGATATPRWLSIYHTATQSLGGTLHQTGGFTRTTFGSGLYRYRRRREDKRDTLGVNSFASKVIGWQWIEGPYMLWVAGGIASSVHVTDPDDPGNRLRGAQLGLRAEFGMHVRMGGGWLISAHGTYQSAHGDWRIGSEVLHRFGALAVGAEATAMGNVASSEWHVGAVGRLALFKGLSGRLSGGFAQTRDKRQGPYATMAGWWSF